MRSSGGSTSVYRQPRARASPPRIWLHRRSDRATVGVRVRGRHGDTVNQAKPFYRSSTFYVFVGLALGVLFGGFLPSNTHPTAYNLFRFCSKAFIALIKGLIVPLLFSTIVVGVAQTGDIKAVGRIGGKAL